MKIKVDSFQHIIKRVVNFDFFRLSKAFLTS